VPSNKATPIAAQIRFKRGDGAKADLSADFDWRQKGEQTWEIDIATADGMALNLKKGGSILEINGKLIMEAPLEEYEMIYTRFAELLRSGKSDTDVTPLQLVCDCFMLGRPVTIAEFA
jgi:D-galactose 1-dehydrogenase